MHLTEGYWADVPVLNPAIAPTAKVDYMILSVAAAF